MVITVGRQHGSNGHDIAKKLADALGYECYDKEIVDRTAEVSGFSRDILSSFDERKVSNYVVATPHYISMSEGFKMSMQISSAQFDTIRTLAEKGNAVFVGRCADYILRYRSDLVRVFVMADKSFCVETMMKRRGLSEEQAKKLVREVDKDRASYYKYYTDQSWGSAQSYDLCINSGKLGVDGSVEVIKAYVLAAEKGMK